MREETRSSATRYEERDVRWKPIAALTGGLIVLVLLALAVSLVLDDLLRTRAETETEPHPLQELREGPPAPRLQAVPSRELDEHLAIVEEALGSYRWIDREEGLARIPIERAMEIVAERGLPVRGDAPAGRGDGEDSR